MPVEARGDGGLWPQNPVISFSVDQSGTVVTQNIHWVDVNINVDITIEPMPVHEGAMTAFAFHGAVLQLQADLRPLPPVTVRQSVNIEVPVGALGARGN